MPNSILQAKNRDIGAYDENDPKHPNWAQRQHDKVDMYESTEVNRLKALTKRLLG